MRTSESGVSAGGSRPSICLTVCQVVFHLSGGASSGGT